jgi:hypothetical protein
MTSSLSLNTVLTCARCLAASALAILLLNAPAHACRENRSPEQRIARIYQLNLVKAVVLVRVDRASSGKPVGDSHPWQASANTARVLQGEFADAKIILDGGLGSSLCDLGYQVPKSGDEWIVYVGFGDAGVLHAFPAEAARKADPRLR